MILIVGGILIGFFASFISALFGGGAGLITVPTIYWLLSHYTTNHHHLMQITVTTGASIAIPIGVIATLRHYRYHNIDKTALTSTLFPVLFGAAMGTMLLTVIDSHTLKLYFGIMVIFMAFWVLRFNPERGNVYHLSKLKLKFISALVGLISMTVGVSVFTVPFLMKIGLPFKKAIGTSTVLVFGYSILGALSLIALGIAIAGISPGRVGYLYAPIFLSAIIPAIIGSILGAKLAHILPQHIIKYCFVAMMVIAGMLMI